MHYPVPAPAGLVGASLPTDPTQTPEARQLEPRSPPIPCPRMQVNSQGGGEGRRPRLVVVRRAPGPKGKASYNPAPCLLTNEEIATCLPNFKTRYY